MHVILKMCLNQHYMSDFTFLFVCSAGTLSRMTWQTRYSQHKVELKGTNWESCDLQLVAQKAGNSDYRRWRCFARQVQINGVTQPCGRLWVCDKRAELKRKSQKDTTIQVICKLIGPLLIFDRGQSSVFTH